MSDTLIIKVTDPNKPKIRVIEENTLVIKQPAAKGDKGDKGDPGDGGLPPGGFTGQLAAKASDVDGDVEWVDPPTSAVWGGIVGNITDQADLVAYIAAMAFSGSYNDLTDKPFIPTKFSDLTNDTLNNVNNTSDANKPVSTAQQAALDLKINLSEKAAALGVATLGADGKLATSQIPPSLLGAANYQGTWNALTNSPALATGVGTKGYYYVVTTAGSTNLDGESDWKLGDWAIYNGTAWQKVDNTDAVLSVNGLIGAVTLTTDNIAEGATRLYFTVARVLATVLTGLSTATNAVITSADTVLSALGKLQAQISGLSNRALSNLTTTSVNESLIPQPGKNLGSPANPWAGLSVASIDHDGSLNIDVANRVLKDSSDTATLLYGDRQQVDTASAVSIDWENRELKDNGAVNAIEWKNRFLLDDAAVLAVDWKQRRLYASDGVTVAIDHSNATGPTTITQAPGDNSTKIATTEYVETAVASIVTGTNLDGGTASSVYGGTTTIDGGNA